MTPSGFSRYNGSYQRKTEMNEAPILHEPEPIHISYANGAIRNSARKLVAWYDYENGLLYINGIVEAFRVMDLEMAMEIVGEKAER